MDRIKEPSTWAGLGLIFQGIGQLVASKGADMSGWASVWGGVAAVFIREKGKTA